MADFPTTDTETAPTSGVPCVRAMLFDAEGADRECAIDAVDPARLDAHQLLWVDIECQDDAQLQAVARRLPLPPALLRSLLACNGTPALENHGEVFHAHVVAIEHVGELRFEGQVVSLVTGPNFVLSVHRNPIAFLDRLRARDRGETELGALSAESFTAALLDWHLSTYFDAVATFEAAVDRLEISVLSRSDRNSLAELQQLRRGAARLRRMLAPHRAIFAGLARPDFRPRAEKAVNVHFHALEMHYERAMDMVENARDLVVGSFELYTTRTAQRTNDTMRALTFITALLGSLALAAGVLGMNFEAPFFATGAKGFWIAITAMALALAGALLLARWRRWF